MTLAVRTLAYSALALPVACSMLVDVPELSAHWQQGDGGSTDGDPSVVGQRDGTNGSHDGAAACSPETGALFCADFDQSPALEFQWTRYEPSVGAPLTLDTTDVLSAPRSLRATATGDAVRSHLERDLGPVPKHLIVRFGVLPDSESTPYAELVRLAVGDTQTFRFRFQQGTTATLHHKTHPDGGDEVDEGLFTGVIPSRTWTQVTLDLDFSGSSYRILFGGEVKKTGLMAPLDKPGAPLTLSVGVVSLETGFTSGTFHFDDVIVVAP